MFQILRTVTIGAGVTVIGKRAFYDCDGLTSVTLPASVTEIGQHAFKGCTALEVINVPQGSFAAQYCQDNGLPYAYPDSLDWLID